ncbi:MAG: type II secretion system F family protein [Candidatus Micrarchaeia archaeon]
MASVKNIFYRVGCLFPDNPFAQWAKRFLRHAGAKMEAREYLGMMALDALAAGMIGYLLPIALGFGSITMLSALMFIAFFAAGALGAYLDMYFKVAARREKVEASLPDFLMLLASYIRSGLAGSSALKACAREDFEPLSGEINYEISKSLGSVSFSDAIIEICSAFDSETLERSLSIFATSSISGGNVPLMLENISNELRESQKLKSKLVTGVNVYLLFIVFTLIVSMPILFSVALKFVQVAGAMPETAGFAPPVEYDFLYNLCLIALAVTALAASMLVGVVREGSATFGLRYAPFLMIGVLASFLISKFVVLEFLFKFAV